MGHVIQSDNVDKVRSTTLYGYTSSLPIATAVNANVSQVYVDDFEDGTLNGWSEYDFYTQGNTTWQNENGSLKITDYGSAINYEGDCIVHDNGTEISGTAVFEFDIRVGYCNDVDLSIGMGGNAWAGSLASTSENAVWTAITGTTWEYYSGTWQTIKSGLTVGKKYHFKIVANSTTQTADYYVDGVRQVKGATFYNSTTGFQKIAFGNYGFSTVNTIWYIDNVRFYPAGAMVSSQGYDPNTRQVSSKTDPNGVSTYYQHDGFGRITAMKNDDKNILSSQAYYYSCTGHSGNFSSTDPNSSSQVTYTSPNGYSDFSSSSGWTTSGNILFDTAMYGEQSTVRMGTGSGDTIIFTNQLDTAIP